MAESRLKRKWVPVLVFALALYVIVRAADTPQSSTPPPAAASTPASTPSTASRGPSASASANPSSYDPAQYAPQVRKRARQAGVDAQLLMAILYNESYKPHDPALERAWQMYKPDAAFGIADMHHATFDAVKQGRDFAGRSWEELPDDRDLAIEAAAWYLHDLAADLPATWTASYTKDELLALGYNAGPGNMLAFARGATPGTQSRSYLDSLHTHWAKAGKAVGM